MGVNSSPLKLCGLASEHVSFTCIGQVLYLNKPITCWAPVHFTGAHTKFMTSYCWVKNTYYLPWDDHVPMYDDERRQMVPYYQWIPFILLAQVRQQHQND